MNLKKVFVLVLLFCFSASLSVPANDQKEPINWRKFIEFFPDIPGWDKVGDVIGSMISSTIKLSQAEQNYVAGEKKIKILFFDSVGDPMLLSPIKGMLATEVDTNTQYIRKFEVGGHPGAVLYDFNSKGAQIVVLIAFRFYLHITGENIEEQAVNDVKAITKLIDIAGIAELGK